ncbi:MAG: T9SS C-terminal target domain-containing protein [Acidobacteria bacterium]|nr:T9SS C-terminal target domain-containing protein [Acidobacteriota bacterium]
MKRLTGQTAIAGMVALVAVLAQGDLRGQTSVPGIDKPVVVHRGTIAASETWVADYYHVLRGAVFVADGATLTIQAGTTVVGETATIGTLIISQGAKIEAVGTASAPIVFTSDQPVGERARADWGGIIINGRAPINLPGGVGLGEGDVGEYGGNDPNDDSGTLQYVRVEFAGVEFSPDNELNGIAFEGVGRGTVVDHVQVKDNKDDCVEFFGGTVDVKHILLTSCADDSLDWTFGWTGRAQYVIIQQHGDDADNGFESDNNGNNNDLLPRSNPTIYNATLIGAPGTTEGNESDDGMEIREGTAATIKNFIVMGFKENGIDFSNTATLTQWANGNLVVTNGVVFDVASLSGGFFDSNARPLLSTVSTIVTGQDPGLTDPYNIDTPNFRPSGLATLAGGQLAPATPPNDGFFEVTTFIGALSPNASEDWTEGAWTNFDRN